MSKDNHSETSSIIPDEIKEIGGIGGGSKPVLSKFEYDLYHEEDDISMPIIRIKHFNLPRNGDRWKIFKDNKIMMTIEGAKLNKKERAFLRGLEGINFLISEYKNGTSSFNAMKKKIKLALKKRA